MDKPEYEIRKVLNQYHEIMNAIEKNALNDEMKTCMCKCLTTECTKHIFDQFKK